MIARSSTHTHTHTHTHTVGTVKRKGFTIIQLVIGMLIFAILTGIAFFGISVYTAQANETRVASDLGTFEVAIKDYMLNNPGACSDGTLNPVGLNHYLTKENTLALNEADPNKDDLGTEISVAAGVKSEAAYKKLSVLEDPWGHQYRVVIRNNADRTTEDGEYGAKGTDRAFIYVYSMGKDGKGAANDSKQDDSVLCVQYSDGEVYSRSYLPSDGKNQAITAPAYTYWNKDQNGKHSVMKDSIFAVGAVDPSKVPGKENGSSGGSGSSGGTGGGSGSNSGSDESTTRNGKIPAGATYTDVSAGKVLKGDDGDSFPDSVGMSDVYKEGDYAYTYHKGNITTAQGGTIYSTGDFGKEWSVKAINQSKDSYGEVLSEIAGKPVTSMHYAFAECKNLVVAPKIPESVTSLNGTFESCRSLTTAPTIPSTVTDMNCTFDWCTSLRTYVGSKDADGDFSDYVIPNSVVDMTGTFVFCTAITFPPEFPSSVANVSHTFNECSQLCTAPVIPEGVTDVRGIFANCGSLKTYVGSKDENGDFSNYKIPSSVTSVTTMFRGTPITIAPTIPDGVTDMACTFMSCWRLTTAPVIPSSVTNMKGTFRGCEELWTYAGSKDNNEDSDEYGNFSNYTIPDGVTDMSLAFAGCKWITRAPVIPHSVENVKAAFSNCTSLTGAVTVNANPATYDDCFKGAAKPITLHGTSTLLNELAKTAKGGNVAVG